MTENGRRGPTARHQEPIRLRYMNVLKFAAMAAALAGGGHVLHNTAQFPDIPSRWNPVTWFTGETTPSKIEITRTEPADASSPQVGCLRHPDHQGRQGHSPDLADRQSGSQSSSWT
jgi:hypothetical protein